MTGGDGLPNIPVMTRARMRGRVKCRTRHHPSPGMGPSGAAVARQAPPLGVWGLPLHRGMLPGGCGMAFEGILSGASWLMLPGTRPGRLAKSAPHPASSNARASAVYRIMGAFLHCPAGHRRPLRETVAAPPIAREGGQQPAWKLLTPSGSLPGAAMTILEDHGSLLSPKASRVFACRDASLGTTNPKGVVS